ncbi:hypothetical protein EXIGLDRAFT_725918 [Exidia glandulosa HHB12029]|uniref:Uncharacterized protein n=1 Tax=Exidia glandulosa HHB12029 TaxID=1314781 RepID=A0A165MII9_EXIGL|nr:hypothetical protein EXIGLDRAFT_725918 [Exidia glandulosa HHB12029]
MSSPMGAQSSSPIATVQAKRSGQYKSRSHAPRRPSGSATPLAAEATEKALMRERLLAKCAEQRQRDRARARSRSWANSSDGERSSDHDVPMDAEFDDEDADDDNDLLIGRILERDHRRVQHKLNRSFDYEVGSSPGIPEDLLEEFFNTEEPPDDDAEYADLYDEYIATLQGIGSTTQQSDGDSAMSDDFPSTPQHQIRRYTRSVPLPGVPELLSCCPSCAMPWSLTDSSADHFSCPRCTFRLSPAAVSNAWYEDHTDHKDLKHKLAVTTLPDGPLLVCAADRCDWCCDL